MGSNEVALAAIGLVTVILTFVVKPLFGLLKANTAATTAQAKAAASQAEAMRELVKETRKGNQEAKERNGHLGEQNIQITELIAKMNTSVTEAAQKNYEAITNIHEQHVKKQIVQHETVKSKD